MFEKAATELGYHPFRAHQQYEPALHQYRGPYPRRLPVFGPLRQERLRGKRQGGTADLHSAAAARRREVHAALPFLGQPVDL